MADRLAARVNAAQKRIVELGVRGDREGVVARGNIWDVTEIWGRLRLPEGLRATHNLVMWDRHASSVEICFYKGDPSRDARCAVCVQGSPDMQDPKTLWKYAV